ncbi:putative carbonic anhydrase Nce103 [Aspergillus nomiae NRRL 13137]|uniref:Carbonic anhydrase n=1 Tax=Aspergillus nomiae NRRL (strain ATCC 15546 / NRRL 13137 / CBS 260.88 / M93) TaxID=1509407 RepID=A0A0L1J210_ASPN3|nr:putative carbonic anhydrase Nce103 [Aspergillus nomiae NRRL 13137]KNG85710.1 putative carbonic anhydrase Nce103 [Aspergillus nomiae NRRL 13137]
MMNLARLVPRSQSLFRPLAAVRDFQGCTGSLHLPLIRARTEPVIGQSQRLSLSTSASLSCDKHDMSQAETNYSPDRFTTALQANKEWAARTALEHPDLFPTLANGQSPEILWIGCSDSRCPETVVLGLKPGDVFVHRNIANILHAGDLSSGAVIEYAVRHLRVNHIVLSGHTKCGGIAAALGNKQLGILDPWLLPLRQIREQNLALLQTMSPEDATGVKLLKSKGVVLEAMHERGLQVHGLIYDVACGMLRDIDTKDSEEEIKRRLVAFKTEA